ncbi:MAG: hypothetical protein IPK07_34825 [Deltaproteobacteria bacterium]|nr:hypothetical protein [Deltaproteobacteria bacterium]
MSASHDSFDGAVDIEARIALLGGPGALYHDSLHPDLPAHTLGEADAAVLRAAASLATVRQVLAVCGSNPAEALRRMQRLSAQGVIRAVAHNVD